MPQTSKKFLNQAGVTYLWQKIVAELNNKVNSISATDNSVTIGGTTTAPTVAVKISPKTGNLITVETNSGEQGLYAAAPAQVTYSITKDETSTDYAAIYHLTADGINTGVAINIPKDMVVSSGTVETKTTSGAWGNAGTYLHLVLANAQSSDIYINVGDLIEYVTSGSSVGDMIVVDIDNNHRVTATITDGTITKTKLASTVQASLNLADSALQSGDIAEGSTNGTISVDGTDISVHGLGTAAFTSSTAYDVAGAAQEVYDAIIALTNTEIDSAIASASNS